jgi:glycosyltransferase involved in cell wall biosynthesis
MRIGIFTECYKPVINGVVNSVIGFKSGLEELGHEVFVFCPTYNDYIDDPRDKNIIHCPSFPIPGKSGYHYIFSLNKKIKDLAKTMDIIHVQHPFIMGARAVSVSKEFNIPIAFTNHTQYDQYLHYIPLLNAKTSMKILLNYLHGFTKKLDLIIAPAKGIKNKLESFGVKTPIEIVPNGIDTKKFNAVTSSKEINIIRKKLLIDPDYKILIYTGRIAEEKNLTFLLSCFKKLIIDYPETFLILAGGGLEIEKFKKMIIDLKLLKNACVTGFISYDEVAKYLDASDMYITCSKSEVHPLTLLEAMASGLPSVIVKAPGTGDIITDNVDGLIANENIDDVIKKIIALLANKKLYSIISNNALKTSSKYSIISTTKRLLEAYEITIKNHNKGRGK